MMQIDDIEYAMFRHAKAMATRQFVADDGLFALFPRPLIQPICNRVRRNDGMADRTMNFDSATFGVE